jgi:hypothetical protein
MMRSLQLTNDDSVHLFRNCSSTVEEEKAKWYNFFAITSHVDIIKSIFLRFLYNVFCNYTRLYIIHTVMYIEKYEDYFVFREYYCIWST